MAREIEFVKCLGNGSFGVVSLVKLTDPDGVSKYSAMKVCKWWNYDSLNREIQVLSKLRGCPRIVQSFGNVLEEDFSVDGHKIYKMFLEFAAGGTLEDYMSKYMDRRLPDQIVREITRMLLEGLVSIHSRGYVHCDLKPENILIFPGGVKISDFGLSREVSEKDDWWEPDSPFWATPLYMSPESVIEGKIEKSLDIWSLGCVVLEMYSGESPWPYEDEKEIMHALKSGEAPEIPPTLPWDARQFLETCFARNPKDRFNTSDLLEHSFLRSGLTKKVNDRTPVRSKIGNTPPKPIKLKIIPPRTPESKSIPHRPLRLKIIPPRPLKSKNFPRRPLRLKIIPPRPPAFNIAVN